MRLHSLSAPLALVACAHAVTAVAAPPAAPDKNKLVAEATGGTLKAIKGKYFDKSCSQSLDYEAEVVDLNGDGQAEVFTSVQGTCLGGMAGVHLNLYVKDKHGAWKPQFGFPGMHTVLPTKSRGWPDIEIGGPGNCFPVWRWNGQAYALHKKCR